MDGIEKIRFDPAAFLTQSGLKREVVGLKPKATLFSQGDAADSVFYIQSGRVKLTVTSQSGKEATIAILSVGDFVGEDSIAETDGFRGATATAVTLSTVLKIRRTEMLRAVHEEHAFSDLFLKFLLARSIRTQADIVDQLFNSCEKRLARILLLMADFDTSEKEESVIPKISQETLAEMIGTTRSRVSFFMNSFRKRGFIEYNGGIRIKKSLLSVVLQD